MPKRKESSQNESSNKKIEIDLNLSNSETEKGSIEIPDLSKINIDEIENTIFKAVKRNNFSNAKAKYLIKEMLKHPHVVQWFRSTFSSDSGEFSLSYEPRVTRAARRRGGGEQSYGCTELTPGLIGRLLLSIPTITSVDFEGEDGTDIDYSPEQSESDDSSISIEEECETVEPSTYLTRSKNTINNDLEIDIIDEPDVMLEEIDSVNHDPHFHQYHLTNNELSLEEMQSLMDTDVDGQLYNDFKRSLNMDSPKYDFVEEDPEFDVFTKIGDLDEDIFDDCRDDRAVKIAKSELWALLKDNKLVNGSENSCSNKKTITLLCEKEETSDDTEPCGGTVNGDVNRLLQRNSLEMNGEERSHLRRQMSMFYQILATNFVMLYDQPHLSRIVSAQVDLYFKVSRNIVVSCEETVFNPPNRMIVENILLNYKGLNILPSSRFIKNLPFKKIDFPKCIIATLLCSSAFPHRELLPTSFKLFNTVDNNLLRPTPFLVSEDKLLTLGIIQFRHQSHKMLKLIHKHLFPIRTTEQLRYRKTNLLRRHRELPSTGSALLVDLLHFSSSSSSLKVCSDFSNISSRNWSSSSLWQRQEEWRHLPPVYLKFLRKTVPGTMTSLNLSRGSAKYLSSSSSSSKAENQPQFCNWSSLPWEMETVDIVKSDSKKQSCSNTVLRKIVKDKSFPQYEIPKDSNFRRQLEQWNCYLDKSMKKKMAVKKSTVMKRRSKRVSKNVVLYRHSHKLVSRSKKMLIKAKFKRADISRLLTQQSYAHYFRKEDTEKLFPARLFRSRLDELVLQHKKHLSLRLRRFQEKCRLRDGDVVDMSAPFNSNRDEDDLRFCRGLLNDIQTKLSPQHYEHFLSTIYHFHLQQKDSSQFQTSVLNLMKTLIEIVKSSEDNGDIYQDLVSLLTPQQALQLGCDIEYNRIKNYNQFYMMTKSTKNGNNRRFWSRLSSLMNKVDQGSYSMPKVIQYLTNNLKHNPYLQSLIAPLLNCWETPYPNFPETFANFDFLASSNSSRSEFSQGVETDSWEYCTELSAPSKNICECSCHDNIIIKEGSSVKHCTKCSLKVSNGSVYLDEGKLHKRLVRIKWPSDFQSVQKNTIQVQDDITRTSKNVDTSVSMSVLDFLKSPKTALHLHNRCISVKDVHVSDEPKHHQLQQQKNEPECPNYIHVLRDDEAAMDVDIFRQIKGASKTMVDNDEFVGDVKIPNFGGTVKQETSSTSVDNHLTAAAVEAGGEPWSEEENMILLTECQEKGPSQSTFESLQQSHLKDRSLEQIETQFNCLFQQLLDYHNQHSKTEIQDHS